MRAAILPAALLALAAAAACASGGSAAPPETLSGGFVVVGIEGRLQPLERGGDGAPAAACAGAAGGGGAARLDRSRRFQLAAKQRDACGGEVERELSGTYVRRGEHLGFVARLPDGATLRFRGTTDDTTLVVRLSGAEIHLRRAGR